MKRTVPLVITFVVGTLLIVATFIPHPPISHWAEDFNVFFDLIAAVAFILGGGNLVRMHSKRVANKHPSSAYSIICLAGFFGMLIVGLLKLGPGEFDLTADLNRTGSFFQQAYEYIFKPLGATIFALLAFFIASASYRAFRARNVDATLLLGTALIILVARTFVGPMLTSWLPPSVDFLDISNMANWIMSWPNRAGNRAILIGVALGTIAVSLKVILGIDRAHLGEKE
jgi:uncharacterized membrane protein